MTRIAGWALAVLLVACGAGSAFAQKPGGGYDDMTDKQLFELALHKGIGECYVGDARSCKRCFADYYVKSKVVRWSGRGWPLNPRSKDSTGASVPAKRKNYICWNGYNRKTMCRRTNNQSKDVVGNAAAQLRDAIKHPSNPCGLKKA